MTEGRDGSPGLLIVISAPSGAGKTTLAAALMQAMPGLGMSVSHTTRPRRPRERHGVDYYFTTDPEFDALVAKDAFLEWAEVHDHRYGTSRAEVERLRSSGRHVLFDVDYQGGISLMEAYPEALTVFILPPSFEELERRIRNRRTESPESIERRLNNARHEVSYVYRYAYTLINDDLEQAKADLLCIVKAALHRTERMKERIAPILEAARRQ